MLLKGKEFIEHESGLFVSSDGEVYVPSNRARKEHFTFGHINSQGRLLVMRNGKNYQVHRLVAECWLINTNNLPTVDHIDRNPKNNDISNLRWADRSLQCYNRDTTNFKNNAKSKKVLQYTLDGELVNEWPSTWECHRNGFDQSAVSKCCREELPHYKKFIWRYY